MALADAANLSASTKSEPAKFSAPALQWWQAIAYCLLLALIGLGLWPVVIFAFMFLAWRWNTDRYAFLVELVLLLGGFALLSINSLPVKTSDLALMLAVVGFMIYRRNKLVQYVTFSMLAYFAALFLIASTSVESMSVQFLMIRFYMTIAAFFIPLIAFANRDFEWDKFARSVILHTLVICGFYVIDTFILNGYLLVPGANAWGGFYLRPLSFTFPRHYPPGLYWLIFLIVPLNYGKLRLSWQQWTLVVLAIFSARTNSLLFALIGCFVLFRPKLKQVIIFGIIGVVAIAGGYFVDKATGGHLRLAENLEQFTSLQAAQDDEDLAEFGTGRMAQILPKWELLTDLDRKWLGFGFLHATKTTNPIFQIRNDYYSDVSQAEETATAVEVTQVQTILDCGYLGLIIQTLFYFGLYFILRRYTDKAKYYLCAVVGVSILGIGGFGGLNQPVTLMLVSTVLGAVILDAKQKQKALKAAKK